MHIRSIVARSATTLAVTVLLAPVVACDIAHNLASVDLRAQAKDEWSRTYTVAAGGRLEISNTNGKISVEPGDGASIEIRAERIAKGRDDQAAKAALERVTIVETQSGNVVRIETKTDRSGGFMKNLNAEVNYRVRMPRGLAVKLSNTNGDIDVTGLRGGLDLDTTNGAIVGRDLGGALKAETVNGAVTLNVAELAQEGITAGTVNGSVKVNLPADARATIKVRTTNGGIDVTGFTLEGADRGRQRLDAKVNGGGAPIAIETTNGGVTIGRVES